MATIADLALGTKIQIEESADVFESYTLIQHDYNPGKALLFRDSSIGTGQWRSVAPSSSADNLYQGSTLDAYLSDSWYPALPELTRLYLQSLDYPVADTNYAGSAITISRHAATISATEAGAVEIDTYGSALEYSDTLYIGVQYWSRQPIGGMNKYAYCIGASSGTSNVSASSTKAIRPTLGVLETQLVMNADDGVSYKLCMQCTAPEHLYLEGIEANFGWQNPDAAWTLSWSEGSTGTGEPVGGYKVYVAMKREGPYFQLAVLDADTTSLVVPGPHQGYRTLYYRVQTVAPSSMEGCDSEMSETIRYISTKRTNVMYHDGSKWLLGIPMYYTGTEWKTLGGFNYYDGTTWHIPSQK